MHFLTKARFVVALLLILAALPVSAQEVIDRIVARVDTDIILLSDIRELARYQLFIDGQSETDQQILDRLVDQWIVRNEAKAALFSQPSDEEVKRSLERLKRSFSSPDEFEARKKQTGLTDEDIERMLRSQLYLSNYLDSRFRASIQIDEKDIEGFYKSRVVPRASSRGQPPPPLDAARGFIQEVLVQRAINVQSERWLKESRARVRVENLLNDDSQEGAK
jgi:parvulin-like peptidyl-prolyl isomerase